MTPESNKGKILIADDEEGIVQGLSALLSDEGFDVETARDGAQALKKLQAKDFDVVIADLKMPKLDGLGLLAEKQNRGILSEIIMITGKGTIDTAVKAMKLGAYDYLTKPVQPNRLRTIVPKALEHRRLLVAHRVLEKRVASLTHFEELIGQSKQMQEVFRLIEAVANSTANVLITGESGTGKEPVARAIHKKSARAQGPMIAVNCAAFPRDLLESEIFGHEKGAFTGAIDEKPGCFELAHNGTIFLDEVGDMALETQAKILRVLEERKFRRLGGSKEIEVDVRIISATNKDLQQALEEKTLREDLHYRLCVVEIHMPPLRDRVGDLVLLMDEFKNYFVEQNRKHITGFSPDSIEIMARYSWPGNVRELKNVVERAVVLCQDNVIQPKHLPNRLINASGGSDELWFPLGTTIEQCERELIGKTLTLMNNNKTKAAKVLGISLKTLHNKLNKYRE